MRRSWASAHWAADGPSLGRVTLAVTRRCIRAGWR
jgi:hypothetical protein